MLLSTFMRISGKFLYLAIKFCFDILLQGEYCHIVITCGLCFAINRTEMDFLRVFLNVDMVIVLE